MRLVGAVTNVFTDKEGLGIGLLLLNIRHWDTSKVQMFFIRIPSGDNA